MYGRIESAWQIKGDSCFYHFEVPANTSATLYLNAISLNDIKVGNFALIKLKGIKYLGADNGNYIFELQPGNYNIQVKGRKNY